jgi:Arc/MetJ family transcription regulator
MKRLSITVDPELLEESRRLAGVKTKRATVELALRDFVRKRRMQELAKLEGSDLVDMSPADLREWREAGAG